MLRARLEGGQKGDSIKCSGFQTPLRVPFAAYIRTAGARAKDNNQVGPVYDYTVAQEAYLKALKGPTGNALVLMPRLCYAGVLALPGSTMLTFGQSFNPAGRTATITADEAIELGAWISVR